MQRIKNKTAREACKKIALKYYLPTRVVEEILYQYYNMIAEDIRNGTYDNPESFLNFNLPKLGKLYVSKRKLERKLEKDDESTNGGS
jgi:hypothetical protein